MTRDTHDYPFIGVGPKDPVTGRPVECRRSGICKLLSSCWLRLNGKLDDIGVMYDTYSQNFGQRWGIDVHFVHSEGITQIPTPVSGS
jgi:hypothetical protein